jgi:hypothetical protein
MSAERVARIPHCPECGAVAARLDREFVLAQSVEFAGPRPLALAADAERGEVHTVDRLVNLAAHARGKEVET